MLKAHQTTHWRPGFTSMSLPFQRCLKLIAELYCQAWESSTAFAEAYRIGKLESQAAMNLFNHVPKQIVIKLSELIRSLAHMKYQMQYVFLTNWGWPIRFCFEEKIYKSFSHAVSCRFKLREDLQYEQDLES